MNRYFSYITFFLIGLLFLSSCGDLPVPSPIAQNNCEDSTPTGEIETSSSWTWLEITINKSTSAGLIAIHGEPISKQSVKIDTIRGCTYQYKFQNANTVFFTVVDGQIREILFHSPTFPLEINGPIAFLIDAINLYGSPDLVGFNKVYGSHSRTVVWASKGVQAVVGIGQKSSINGTLSIDISKAHLETIDYFTPMSPEEYPSSFYSHWYSETFPETDIFDPYSRDPFIWSN